MKKLFLLFLLAGMLAGCGGVTQNEDLPDSAVIPGFTRYLISVADKTAYLVDNRTGVVYIKYAHGLTVMLNADGSPVTKEQLGLK